MTIAGRAWDVHMIPGEVTLQKLAVRALLDVMFMYFLSQHWLPVEMMCGVCKKLPGPSPTPITSD